MREKLRQVHALGKRAAYSKSFRRYIFVGISTVAIDYLMLLILRKFLSSSLVLSVSIAYWTSIVYNFTLNRLWSFEASKGMVPRQILLYGCLLLFNYLITITIVAGLESLGMSEYIAKLFALVLTISWTYILYKKIVFKVGT